MAAVPSHSKITTCSSMRACLAPTWLTLCTHRGEGKCANCSHQSARHFGKMALAGRSELVSSAPSLAGSFGVRDEMIREWFWSQRKARDTLVIAQADGQNGV